MTTPDSEPGFQALLPAETRWENRVAARVALRVAGYRPGRSAARVACPALFCVCDRDAVAPSSATVRFAQAAPRGEIKHYPVGHFAIYVGEPWERAVADQTGFLMRHLGVDRQRAEIEGAAVRS
jgi:poly(3-hydroxyalkanoate) synthetase